MRKTLLTASTLAMAALIATLVTSCSKQPEAPATEASQPPVSGAALSTQKSPPAHKKLDDRVPTLAYDEMADSKKSGWDKVDGPAWPGYVDGPNAFGDCKATGPAQCKETYYGGWCRDECGNVWGVVQLITGNVCNFEGDVRLCREF